jgi:hypothetical protein
MDEDVRGLGRPLAGPPHSADHPLNKSVTLPQFLELLGGEFQPGTLDQDGETLG